jgi:DNA-binding MarR family transcriptional regulator
LERATRATKGFTADQSVGRLLRRINKLLDKRIQMRFSEAEFGRPYEEWMALKLIFEGLVETAGDLARDFGIGTGATTRLIDSLEDQNLVYRERTHEDRRRVLVKMTPLGRKVYRSKAPVMKNCWNQLLRDFDDDSLCRLIALLSKLEAAFGEDDD